MHGQKNGIGQDPQLNLINNILEKLKNLINFYQLIQYDEVLDYIDNLKKQNNKVKIRYITATNLRNEFLQYWEKHDLSHAK